MKPVKSIAEAVQDDRLQKKAAKGKQLFYVKKVTPVLTGLAAKVILFFSGMRIDKWIRKEVKAYRKVEQENKIIESNSGKKQTKKAATKGKPNGKG